MSKRTYHNMNHVWQFTNGNSLKMVCGLSHTAFPSKGNPSRICTISFRALVITHCAL